MNDEILLLWAQWGILNHSRYQKTVAYYGTLEDAWRRIDVSFLQALGFGKIKAERQMELRARMDFGYLLSLMNRYHVRLLFIEDADFPLGLKEIQNPPVFLFVRGQLPLLHKSIGIVGTRLITDYGKLVTEKMTEELVCSGFTIISGLAMGVDSFAHQKTLDCNGVTVAALGSGVDRIFPVANYGLAESIIRSDGAVLSEFPLGTPALAHHFPMRNRLISGLSRGVLVIEGGVRSGALITARYALEQGREVFAVPNNITKKGLSGTNHLIRNGEAKLVETVAHILEDFGMEPTTTRAVTVFSSTEKELIGLILNGGKSIDELTIETTYNVARLSELLIGLQLKGVVREVNRKWCLL